MFIDKNSRKLIAYLSANEPSSFENRELYVVAYLVSSFDKNETHWNADHLKPYLSLLKEKGFIDSFEFYKNTTVHIDRTALLLHFDEYESADVADTTQQVEQLVQQNGGPNSGVVSPDRSFFEKVKEFLSVASNLISTICGLITVISLMLSFLG